MARKKLEDYAFFDRHIPKKSKAQALTPLSAFCEICGKHRASADHTRCSRIKQQRAKKVRDELEKAQ